MAIITEARMQQLRGKYNRLNKEAMLPGEIAICDDHNPVVRTNTGYKEILTKDNAEYFEEKVADINNAISSANEAVNNANQAINDMGTATTENTQKVDNAIAQLETDKEQKFEELDTNVANTVSNAVSGLNTAKEQAISDMETATTENTQKVNNALQQITTKIGIDDTTSSTMTTYSSDKIDKLIEAVGGGGLSIEIVESLPISGIKEKTLYLVPSATSEANNVYDEYIYIDGSWEIIGSTAVDLTNYYKKNEVDTLLGNKVTKEEGKGLFSGSYNDLEDVPTNLATLSDLDKYLKANDNASFYFGTLNNEFGFYTTESRETSDFHKLVTYENWCYSMHIGSDSDPDTAVTYIGDNANFVPAKMNYDTGVFDWGSWANAPFIPRPCMLKSDGTVDYYLNPDNYDLKKDGTPSDVANTSYDGNAMIEWGDGVRPIYLTIIPDSDPTCATVHISNYPVDDTSTCYPFLDSNGNIIKHFYTPCYAGSLINNKLRSISGQVVMQSKTAEQEMTYAQANGDGYNIELTCDRILINFLLLLMAKTLNTENAYGKGNQSGYVNDASKNYGMHNTGTMNNKGLFWGKNVSSASDNSGVKVFGMEDFWGNQWRRMAGLILISGTIYAKLTHSTADGSTVTGYNITGSGYINTGLKCSGTNGGYISKVTYNSKYAIPTVASGSETTYYADGLWFNNSITAFAFVGGGCFYGSCCGAFCLDLRYLASNAGWNIGAALSCKPLASAA